MIKYVGGTISLVSLAALFLWAGFDITWWVEVDRHDAGRFMALVFFHLLGIFGGGGMYFSKD